MQKTLLTFATLISGLALFLGADPGRFAFQYVDAGGHRLRMLIRGRGNPTVVFENGRRGSLGSPLEMWGKVQPDVSRFAQTVAYDQAGTGRSAPGPEPHDSLENARELHTALRNARVAPPYILVGHSFGGPFIRVFASLYPAEVSVLVLVDPTQEEFIRWDRARHPNDHDITEEDWKVIQASLSEAHASRIPAGIPVVLITGMGPRHLPGWMTASEKRDYATDHQMWLKFHTDWLKTVPNGQHLITEESGHGVPFTEPGLIVRVVRQMVAQVRSRP
jgi:pimeloyl-ACP methyl ester carboxylesterase